MTFCEINKVKGIIVDREEQVIDSIRKRYPYMYYLRHGDTDWARPATVEKEPVVVNNAGVLCLEKKLRFRKNKCYIDIYDYCEVG